MKPVYTALFTTAFLAVTYTAATAPANAGGRECLAQTLAKSVAAEHVDTAFDVAIDVARQGKFVRAEVAAIGASVKDEDFAWVDFSNQCLLEDMLNQEIADLWNRANAFRAHEAELLQVQSQVVFGRLERAVMQIELAWKQGKIAADVAQKAIESMNTEAFDYLESLGPISIRERLQEAITVLMERGSNIADRAIAQQEFFVKFYTVRLEAALAVWVARGVDGTATAEDWIASRSASWRWRGSRSS